MFVLETSGRAHMGSFTGPVAAPGPGPWGWVPILSDVAYGYGLWIMDYASKAVVGAGSVDWSKPWHMLPDEAVDKLVVLQPFDKAYTWFLDSFPNHRSTVRNKRSKCFLQVGNGADVVKDLLGPLRPQVADTCPCKTISTHTDSVSLYGYLGGMQQCGGEELGLGQRQRFT